MAEKTNTMTVPMEVEYKPAWLSWVAAATSCLNALGVKCDHTDVAGMSGYAFVMSVSPDLCPSGPTMFDWGMLNAGINHLGRSVTTFTSGDCYTGKFINERTTAHCKAVFELAKSEVSAGRPVVLWGAYQPEFATVYGIEGENYLVKSWKEHLGEKDSPVPWDKIEAPGGPYLMAFPTISEPPNWQAHGDQWAIRRALQLLTQPSLFGEHATGLKAYGNWILGLESNTAHPFGNAYNTQCWEEAKRLAQAFIKRVAMRNPQVAGQLNEAVAAYEPVVVAMKQLVEMFPFPPGEQVMDEAVRDNAIIALRTAKAGEEKVVDALRRVVEMDWKQTKRDEGA